jgi:arylsulfatase A-like enzyme/Flp pilus assembly protein TadD
LISLTVLIACTRAAPTPLGLQRLPRANVLLVTIDTLRADRVGAYGGGALTPTIDRLASEGVRYTHAWSHAPMTLPAHTSILTGLLPPHHGVRNNTSFRLDARAATLATVLERAGYRTGAFVGAFVLDARFGLARGFDVYDDRLPHAERASFHFAERRGAEVVQAAGDWILERTQHPAPGTSTQHPAPSTQHPTPSTQHPWFAWVHLFDPHAPYEAPPEYRAGRSAYDAEVAYADAMLGVLLDRLRAAGQLDRTVVVVTADHGESLGDHGETTHGLFAYDATLRVPLVVRAPAMAARTVDTPVGHVDILPTVLDLVGAPIPDGLDGASLVQSPPADRALYFEALDAHLTRGWAPLRGVVQNGWKYIDLPDAELYDLASDPREAANRVADVSRRQMMNAALGQIESNAGRNGAASSLDADAARRLRSLGYAGATASRSPARATKADDPKTLVALNERFNTALTRFDEGRRQDALAAFLSILAERPDFFSARATAASALVSLGEAARAVRLLQDAPIEQRQSAEGLEKLGTALRAAGDLRQAAAAFEQARRLDDANVDLLQELAVTYAALGRQQDARSLFAQSVARNPVAATTWYNVGLFELQSGRLQHAAEALRRAVDREPSYGEAWQALGAALVRTDAAGAIDAWRRAERLLPRDYDLLFNLGMLSADRDTPANAVPYLQRFVREAPRVLTISVHEDGRWPHTGRVEDRGGGSARNLPVPAGFNDSEMDYLREAAILPLVRRFAPEAIVIQCGADALAEDPLSDLALSNNALWRIVGGLMGEAERLLVLGGGGQVAEPGQSVELTEPFRFFVQIIPAACCPLRCRVHCRVDSRARKRFQDVVHGMLFKCSQRVLLVGRHEHNGRKWSLLSL